jgi:tetratricopeptide (TPR) repeat protein
MNFWLICLFSFSVFAESGPAQLSDRLKLATREYESAHYDRVVELLNPYSEQLPKPGMLMLASAYSNKEKYDEEVRIIKVMVGRDENNYEWQMLLGHALMKQTMKSTPPEAVKALQISAIQAFRACLKLRPKFKPAYDDLLALLLEQKDHNDARELLSEGLEKFGRRPELMKEICRLDSLDGFVAQAVQTCKEAIALSPNYPDSHVYLVQSLFDENEHTAAEQQIVASAKRFPASEFVQWGAGTIFYRKHNYPVSARYYGQAAQIDPESSRSLFGYAQSLYESGQESAALPIFVKACKLKPSEVVETFFSAGSKLRAKDNSLATKYKEQANICHK